MRRRNGWIQDVPCRTDEYTEENREMLIQVTEPYLWLPVDREQKERKLHFYQEGEKFQEVDIQLGGTDADFYSALDVRRYLGKEIEIRSDAGEQALEEIFCYREKPQHVYPFRPQLHFAAEVGWINDPNGLVYADGVYHLYHQWNPYGVKWGNMHWGHAVSRDLITWEQKPMAMEPDRYGTMFSGCGWQDRNNTAGFGRDALLFFYTACSGDHVWAKEAGNRTTQRLAVSKDGGDTLQKQSGAVVEHIVDANRDPKVFRHEESRAYIMVLYLDGYEFAVFRSEDLLHWEESQRFCAEGMWECPDLFELPVENEAGVKKWIFWSADGYYLVGDFDGYRFTPESDVQTAYASKLPYAAQTYSGTGSRVISVAWLRTESDRGNYRGLMSLPAQLSLVKCEDVYRIRFTLPEALEQYLRQKTQISARKQEQEVRLNGRAAMLALRWRVQNTGIARVKIGTVVFEVNFEKEQLAVHTAVGKTQDICVRFDNSQPFDLKLVIDQGIIEFYGNGGLIYSAVEPEENILGKAIVISTEPETESICLYE